MLWHIRAVVISVSLLLFIGGLIGSQAGAAEESSSAAVISAMPTVAPPVLLGQYSGRSRSNYSSGGVRIPYGVIRLVILGMMGAGGWFGSKFYR